MKLDLESERSNEIINLNEINQSPYDNYNLLDLTDYSPMLMNLLSCKCKERVSNKLVTDIIYEYYDSLIDVSNL